ncbi:MAG TPA: hypothetical protein PK957_04390 [Candidatus Dojkabacteria bacterium]|nr:hypothetical protein [Candidatus Dojkabacteria bacterium]HQF36317.1 hypothetical protein [Candidatus Dojkabacteria bacterium]
MVDKSKIIQKLEELGAKIGVKVVDFNRTTLPTDAKIVQLGELPSYIPDGLHRFICYYKDKWSSPSRTPEFGGLVVYMPLFRW